MFYSNVFIISSCLVLFAVSIIYQLFYCCSMFYHLVLFTVSICLNCLICCFFDVLLSCLCFLFRCFIVLVVFFVVLMCLICLLFRCFIVLSCLFVRCFIVSFDVLSSLLFYSLFRCVLFAIWMFMISAVLFDVYHLIVVSMFCHNCFIHCFVVFIILLFFYVLSSCLVVVFIVSMLIILSVSIIETSLLLSYSLFQCFVLTIDRIISMSFYSQILLSS
jgi:hypothetical protein